MAENRLPDGIEQAIWKARSDASFKKELLRDRADAAVKAGIRLEPAESDMMSSIPAEQLEAAIESSKARSWRNRPAKPSTREIVACRGIRPGISIGAGGMTSFAKVLLWLVLVAVLVLILALTFT